MKVFISWSGDTSKQVAAALRDWLQNVVQAIEPWMSAEDIDKGSRWSSEIAKELDNSSAGIVCVVPGNHEAPWLNFEAGALSKAFGRDKVCPYLFRVKPAELTGPLVQFQISEANKEDTHRLLSSLNKGIEPKPLPESKLAQTFEKWWPELEGQLGSIRQSVPKEEPRRDTEDMLNEVLNNVRDQSRLTSEVFSKIEYLAATLLAEMRLTQQEDNYRLVNFNRLMLESRAAKDALSGSFEEATGIAAPPNSRADRTRSIWARPDVPKKK